MYKDKYLKYKNKYLLLKKMVGGNVEAKKKIIKQRLNSSIPNSAKVGLIRSILNSSKPNLDELVNFVVIEVKSMNNEQLENQLKKINYFEDKFNRVDCTIEQYMEESKDFLADNCTNRFNRVKGDCGEPSFLFAKEKNYKTLSSKLLPLFNKLYELDSDKICVVIKTGGSGERAYIEPECADKAVIELDFDTGTERINITDAIAELETLKTSISSKKLMIESYFPLNYFDEESKTLLNLIIEKSSTIKTHLVNNMCHTCFPSFYYLINKSFNRIVYQSSAAQGENRDSIKTCTDL